MCLTKCQTLFFTPKGRLNLLDGEKSNAELLSILWEYIKDITGEDMINFFINPENAKYNNLPEWIITLEKEFSIKPHRGSKWHMAMCG
jgi:hypothetical protein